MNRVACQLCQNVIVDRDLHVTYIPSFPESDNISNAFSAMMKLTRSRRPSLPYCDSLSHRYHCLGMLGCVGCDHPLQAKKKLFFAWSNAENVFVEVLIGVAKKSPDLAFSQCPAGHPLLEKVFL